MKINVGGQAVIEGVMMRSPERIAVAVRRPDGKIVLKNQSYISFTKRHKFWNLPIIRGAVILIESMLLGINALTFSGDVVSETNKQQDSEVRKNIWLILIVFLSFALGLLIFFYLPLILTDLIGAKSGFWFNLVDGILRLVIFLIYLGSLLLWKEVQRIFQYHGAEHKTIFAFEDHKDLTVENSKPYKPFHPRCGTSFIFMVLIVSIMVFMLLGKPDSINERLIRLAFVPLIGGISYEIIKLSDKKQSNSFVKMFLLPGLWFQRITAREPDESMLEVALVALKGALGKDLNNDPDIIFARQSHNQ